MLPHQKGWKSLRPSPVPANCTGIDRFYKEKSIHKCFPVERLQVIEALPNPNKITGIGSSKHGNSTHLCKSSRIYREQCYILINIVCWFHYHQSNKPVLICVALNIMRLIELRIRYYTDKNRYYTWSYPKGCERYCCVGFLVLTNCVGLIGNRITPVIL